jgi:hypothetical protein
MSTEERKALLGQFIDRVINKDDKGSAELFSQVIHLKGKAMVNPPEQVVAPTTPDTTGETK